MRKAISPKTKKFIFMPIILVVSMFTLYSCGKKSALILPDEKSQSPVPNVTKTKSTTNSNSTSY